MYKYISNQDTILESLIENIKNNQQLSIVDGLSGSGKTYILESIIDKCEKMDIFWLKGDPYTTQREYYPFYNLINQQYINYPDQMKTILNKQQLSEVIVNSGSLSPIGGDMISAAIENIVNNKKEKKHYLIVCFLLKSYKSFFNWNTFVTIANIRFFFVMMCNIGMKSRYNYCI